MSDLNDFSTALDIRDVVKILVKNELRNQNLTPSWATVFDIDWNSNTALVILTGDDVAFPVKFASCCAPGWGLNSDPAYPYDPSTVTQVTEPSGGFAGDLVKIEGIPGNQWITEVVYRSPREIRSLPLAGSWIPWDVDTFIGKANGVSAARYWRDSRHVCLDGLVKWTGGSATVADELIGNLPQNFRPGFRAFFNLPRSDFAANSRVDIWTTGEITLRASGLATNGYVSLTGVRFLAEA